MSSGHGFGALVPNTLIVKIKGWQLPKPVGIQLAAAVNAKLQSGDPCTNSNRSIPASPESVCQSKIHPMEMCFFDEQDEVMHVFYASFTLASNGQCRLNSIDYGVIDLPLK
jgi:hypothetical protein